MVRAAAIDSLRRTLRDFTLNSSSDLSPEAVAARNANREAHRKKAAAICTKQFLAAGRLKVLEQMIEDAANEDLAVQAKHVLLYLLQLEDDAAFKAAVDGKVESEVRVWWAKDLGADSRTGRSFLQSLFREPLIAGVRRKKWPSSRHLRRNGWCCVRFAIMTRPT
jgi:hypothetical protein